MPKNAKKSQNTFFLISTVSQKMLLEGLITNSPGIKMGQKNGQKVLKNAKNSQNTFHLTSTVSKLLSEVEL